MLANILWTQDYEFTYELLKERYDDGNVIVVGKSKCPSFEEHCKFWEQNKYRYNYSMIYLENSIKKAHITFTADHEIGIFVLRKYRKQGIAKKAIKELLQLHHTAYPIIARINTKNTNSIGLFENLGFVRKGFIYVKESSQRPPAKAGGLSLDASQASNTNVT